MKNRNADWKHYPGCGALLGDVCPAFGVLMIPPEDGTGSILPYLRNTCPRQAGLRFERAAKVLLKQMLAFS